MSAATRNLLVLLVGAGVVVMLIRGSYLNYVRPALLPWLIAAAVVLVALGVAAVLRDVRDAGRVSSGEHDGDQGHGHGSGPVWLLLIPIALVAFVVPPPLGAAGASAPPATTAPPARPFPPLPAGDAPTVAVPEVVMRAAADSAHSLDGRTITVSGFTLRYPDGTYLGRVVIVCCAADAQLARIRLAGPALPPVAALAENTWVRLSGRIRPGSATLANDFVPTMDVASATPIPKPPNTYAY